MIPLPRSRAELARLIDHTLLKAEATEDQIDRLCDEALEHGFAAVCVNPIWVERCARRIAAGSTAAAGRAAPLVCSVAGFPLGAVCTQTKADEAALAVAHGAREIDMVIHLADALAGRRDALTRDIATVVHAVKRAAASARVKVILETRVLSEAQIVLACECCVAARADFVKTSTGFHASGGATVEHVALLRKHAPGLQVKAAGGIRDLSTALLMIEAGADRLGMSASVAVLREFPGG
jgi:deoxyribose-phosphate aldolase